MGVLQEEGNDQCLSQLILLIWSNLLSCLSNWCFMIQRLWSRASLVAQTVKNLPAMWETWVQSLGWEDPWKRACNPLQYLAWRIPWTEEPEGLQSMGSQRVRQDWANKHQKLMCLAHWAMIKEPWNQVFREFLSSCSGVRLDCLQVQLCCLLICELGKSLRPP